MIPGISRTVCTFKRSMTVLLHFVTVARDACPSFLTGMLSRGFRAGTTHSTTHSNHLTNRCSPIDAAALEVAIRGLGQQLNVEHLVGVTYDLPEGGSNGMFHLHVSFCLIRIDD